MRNQTCCFTGHRAIPKNDFPEIQKRLENEITNLIHQGVRYFGAGGALGFDTMAALTVLRLQTKFPHIRLILVLPCKDQTKGWSAKNIQVYNHILTNADKVVYASERYYSGCMQTRNRCLVDSSGICVCYVTTTFGGTAFTVNYARKKGLQILNLAQ